MEVEGVDGMDAEPESAHASESEEAMESSEGNGAKSQDVQDELVEASQEGREDSETQTPRAAKAPYTPSQREVDEHNLVHCPYRAWCEACVRGQAKDDCHRTITGVDADSSVARVCLDYCFLTEKVKAQENEHLEEVKSNVSMTILVMVETMCRSNPKASIRGSYNDRKNLSPADKFRPPPSLVVEKTCPLRTSFVQPLFWW